MDNSVQTIQEFNETIDRLAAWAQHDHFGLSNSAWSIVIGSAVLIAAWEFGIPGLAAAAAAMEGTEISFWDTLAFKQINLILGIATAKSAVIVGAFFELHNRTGSDDHYDFPVGVLASTSGLIPLASSAVGTYRGGESGFLKGTDYGSSLEILRKVFEGDALGVGLDLLSKDLDAHQLHARNLQTYFGKPFAQDLTTLERSIFAAPEHRIFGDPQNKNALPQERALPVRPHPSSPPPPQMATPPSINVAPPPPPPTTQSDVPGPDVPPPTIPGVKQPTVPGGPTTTPGSAPVPAPLAPTSVNPPSLNPMPPQPPSIPPGSAQKQEPPSNLQTQGPNAYDALLPDYLGGTEPSDDEPGSDNDDGGPDSTRSEGLAISPLT